MRREEKNEKFLGRRCWGRYRSCGWADPGSVAPLDLRVNQTIRAAATPAASPAIPSGTHGMADRRPMRVDVRDGDLGRLRLVWESWLVTIQADLVPMLPGRFKFSLPVTLLQPCSIWTGLPRDKGASTHHVV